MDTFKSFIHQQQKSVPADYFGEQGIISNLNIDSVQDI